MLRYVRYVRYANVKSVHTETSTDLGLFTPVEANRREIDCFTVRESEGRRAFILF